jgi:K+-sensing histidine kinase KdpD
LLVFDVMLERLDTAFNSQRRFVANAAHELRTLLTAMRTAIEVTLSKPARTPQQLEAMAERVKRSVERAEETVEALLTLVTSEAGTTLGEPVDLATAAEDALDTAHAAIDQRRLTVDAHLEPAPTSGDRVLLERMIANLVDNAVRHNNADGWVGIRTARETAARCLRSPTPGRPCPASRSRPCSSHSPAPRSASTRQTALGSACRSPARSRPLTTRRSPPARGRVAGWRCRSRSPLTLK